MHQIDIPTPHGFAPWPAQTNNRFEAYAGALGFPDLPEPPSGPVTSIDEVVVGDTVMSFSGLGPAEVAGTGAVIQRGQNARLEAGPPTAGIAESSPLQGPVSSAPSAGIEARRGLDPAAWQGLSGGPGGIPHEDPSGDRWQTYNFEVETYHTYIAGGIRVHNKSVLAFLPEGATLVSVDFGAPGTDQTMVYQSDDGGTFTVVASGFDSATSTVVKETVVTYDDKTWTLEEVLTYDADGNVIESEIQNIEVNGVQYGAIVGGNLASQIGTHLADGNHLKKIGFNTLLGQIGRDFGEFVHLSFLHGIREVETTLHSIEEIAEQVFLEDLGTELIDSLDAQITGTISYLLMAEAMELFELEGLPAEALTVTGNAVATQVLGNISAAIQDGSIATTDLETLLLDGFDFTAVSAAIGGWIGGTLAEATLVDIDSIGEGVISGISGAVGAAWAPTVATYMGFTSAVASGASTAFAQLIGGLLVPGVGAFLGTIAGSVLFEALDGLFGGKLTQFFNWLFGSGTDGAPEGGIEIRQDEAGFAYVSSDRRDRDFQDVHHKLFDYTSEGYIEVVNNIVNIVGGTAYGMITQVINYKNNVYSHIKGEVVYFPDWSRILPETLAGNLENLQFVDGDLILIKAIDHWKANVTGDADADLAQLQEALFFASEYRRYLDMREAVDAAIRHAPDSAFAAGWLFTLARAATMGLDEGTGDGWFAANHVDNHVIGGEGLDRIDGGDGNDRLEGGQGDDQLVGGAGADELIGGEGFDRAQYHGAPSSVTVDLEDPSRNTGTAAGDTFHSIERIHGGAFDDRLYADAGVNIIWGRDGNDLLDGRAGDDTLFGDGGADHLIGGDGNDVLIGGVGADVLDGGAGVDRVHYTGAAVAVTADLQISGNNTGEAAGDIYIGIERLWGSNHNDSLYGDAAANVIWGWHGDDVVDGRDGNDHLFGQEGNDILWGGAGADRLNGGGGADRLEGGDGRDRAEYTYASAGVVADLQISGDNTGEANGDIYVSIENLSGSSHDDDLRGDGSANVIWAGDGHDMLWGRNGNDTLYGQNGDDILWGGAGADILDGGDGTDRAQYSNAAAGIIVDLELASRNTGDAAGDIYLSIEDLLGTRHDDSLYGDGQGNRIWGGQGNDTIQGRAGDDHLIGQDGDDVLEGDAGNDSLQGGAGQDHLDGGAGIDRASYIESSAGVLADLQFGQHNTGEAQGDTYVGIENLRGSGHDDSLRGDGQANALWGETGNDWLRGRDGDDSLYGQDGHDSLFGGAGADRLDGGAGIDVADYTEAMAAVIADLQFSQYNAGEALGDTYMSIERLRGSVHDDSLRGDAGANVIWAWNGNDWLQGRNGDDILYGQDGNDVLLGGAGEDVLDGGSGVDRAEYGDAAAGVRADLYAPTTNWGEAAGDSYVSIEVLGGSAFDDHLLGGLEADRVWGRAGDDHLHGRWGDDALYGGDGDDRLWGGAGADLLDGGAGFDWVMHHASTVGLTIDLQFSQNNTGEAVGDIYVSIEGLYGSFHDDSLRGDGQANELWGETGNDWLRGRDGDDSLYGQQGDDVLWGGAGADILDGGDGRDRAQYSDATAGVVADLALSSRNTGEAAGDTYISIQDLLGTRHDDSLHGDAQANRIWGGQGNDTIQGRAGDDHLIGQDGNDDLNADQGNDTLWGGSGHDRLWGRDGVDDLQGGDGNDTLLGGAGADILNGGAGRDTAHYNDSPIGLTVDLLLPQNNTGIAIGDQFLSIERLNGSIHDDILSGSHDADELIGAEGDDILNGRAGDDVLLGVEGNDRFRGGAGADVFDGGAGTDLVIYDDSSTGMTADLQFGQNNTGEAAGDIYVSIEGLYGSLHDDSLRGDGQANELWGETGNDWLRGRDGDDSLYGQDGDDVLLGGAGADLLDGGAGIDRASYIESSAGMVADLQFGQHNTGDAQGDTYVGIETLQGSHHDDSLRGDAAANTLWGGHGADWLRGRDGDDHLLGQDGDDVLLGGAGADILDGGAGIDRVQYNEAAAAVTADLQVSVNNTGEAAGDIYIDIERLWGSNHDDSLYGDAAANVIWGLHGDDVVHGRDGNDHLLGSDGNDTLAGGAGNDRLDGGTGADVLDGGAGIDWAEYGHATAGVRADLHAPTTNWGEAAGDSYVSIEVLGGSAFDDHLLGGLEADRVWGRAGDDHLHGRWGDDALYGGDGDDRLWGGAGADLLDGGAGFDWVMHHASTVGLTIDLQVGQNNTGEAAGDIYVSIEGLYGSLHDDSLRGDGQANQLWGETGNDWLRGRDGDDSLYGQDGDDVLLGGAGADILDGGAGIDRASYIEAAAGVLADLQFGQHNTGDAQGDTYVGIETLQGSHHIDSLRGDGQANVIWGGAGNDTLHGRSGDDTLYGQDGDDHLWGNGGDDQLWGQAGADTFRFEAGWGQDTIGDWEDGTDRMLFFGTAVPAGFDDLLISQDGADTLITWSGQSIRLADTHNTTLDAHDFLFP